MKKQRGFTILEMIVAIAIIGVTSVTFLRGFSTASIGTALFDERETGKNMAESLMEYIRTQNYAANYTLNSTMNSTYSDAYPGYTWNITVNNVMARDGNIQKITVNVGRNNKELFRLQGYKVN